jgi:hypothetical protein
MALLDLQGLNAEPRDAESDGEGKASIAIDSVLSVAVCF